MERTFGLLYEIQVPRDVPASSRRVTGDGEVVPHDRTWSSETEHRHYREAVEQAVLAEEVGFSHLWAVEHHFIEEYAHCSAPEVLLAYLAARTNRIRLGHAVRLLPFPYNHPVKVAEQAAVLDLLSDGRLEVGTGRSATRLEMEGFRIDPANTRSMWLEALDLIVHAWTDDVLEWKGQWFDVPARAILPKPLQAPHPPLWVAGTSEESHRLAGELGIGVLSFTILVPPQEMGRRIGLYRDALKENKPIGKTVNPRAAVHTVVHCAKTSKEARKNAGDAFMNWASHYVQDIVAGFARWLDPQEASYDYFKAFTGYAQNDIDFDFVNNNDMVIVGDPDECAEKVKRYVELADMDHLICQMQFHGVPHEKVMESIDLFGRYVIPQFS